MDYMTPLIPATDFIQVVTWSTVNIKILIIAALRLWRKEYKTGVWTLRKSSNWIFHQLNFLTIRYRCFFFSTVHPVANGKLGSSRQEVIWGIFNVEWHVGQSLHYSSHSFLQSNGRYFTVAIPCDISAYWIQIQLHYHYLYYWLIKYIFSINQSFSTSTFETLEPAKISIIILIVS